MQTNEKILAGIIGTVLVIAGFGGNQLLTQDQLDRAYVCPLTEELGFFDRLSDSGKTGYWTIDGNKESKQCRTGNTYESYVSLSEYADSKGVSVEEFLSGNSYETPEDVNSITIQANNKIWNCELSKGKSIGYARCVSDGYEAYLGEITEGIVE